MVGTVSSRKWGVERGEERLRGGEGTHRDSFVLLWEECDLASVPCSIVYKMRVCPCFYDSMMCVPCRYPHGNATCFYKHKLSSTKLKESLHQNKMNTLFFFLRNGRQPWQSIICLKCCFLTDLLATQVPLFWFLLVRWPQTGSLEDPWCVLTAGSGLMTGR